MSKFDHWAWLKLYVREEGSFAALPLYTRALAGELLKFADRGGRIFVGAGDTFSPLMRIAGAHRGDRRMLAKDIAMLIQDGFLRREGDHVVIKNFDQAQRRQGRSLSPAGDVPDAPPPTHPSTPPAPPEEPRTVNDASAMEPRQVPDESLMSPRPLPDDSPMTPRWVPDETSKSEPSGRNHSEHDPEKQPRARGSDPSRDDTKRAEERTAQDQGQLSPLGKLPPSATQVLTELRRHAPLRDVHGNDSLARTIESNAFAAGKPGTWIALAIEQAAGSVHNADIAGEPMGRRGIVSTVVAFCKSANGPREPRSGRSPAMPTPVRVPVAPPPAALPAADGGAGAAGALAKLGAASRGVS